MDLYKAYSIYENSIKTDWTNKNIPKSIKSISRLSYTYSKQDNTDTTDCKMTNKSIKKFDRNGFLTNETIYDSESKKKENHTFDFNENYRILKISHNIDYVAFIQEEEFIYNDSSNLKQWNLYDQNVKIVSLNFVFVGNFKLIVKGEKFGSTSEKYKYIFYFNDNDNVKYIYDESPSTIGSYHLSFTYDSAGNMLTKYKMGPGNDVYNVNGKSYSYSETGKVLAEREIAMAYRVKGQCQYTYDETDRMIIEECSSENSGWHKSEFKYEADQTKPKSVLLFSSGTQSKNIFKYDKNLNVVSIYQMNKFGNEADFKASGLEVYEYEFY